ncbi:MAG TPA: thioredoxin [Fimbriimonadaceae bacterium]|nr:thioredoxin [Fimbriimonadaceae bacterium]
MVTSKVRKRLAWRPICPEVYHLKVPLKGVVEGMAANLAVSGSEFEEKVLNSDVPVLVDFWAEWCGPCKAIGPSVEQLASEFEGRARVYKVDVDNEVDLAQKYGIMSIPALLVFKGGKVVDQMIGAAPKPQIQQLIERAL